MGNYRIYSNTYISTLLYVKLELAWKIKFLFDVKGGEPTEGYIIFSRCMGIFGIIVGIRVLIVYIVK